MSSFAVLKNSDDGQIGDIETAFQPVQKSAAAYEKLQGRANDALYDALEALFAFGQALRAEATRLGRPLVQDFADSHGVRWNAVTAQNPYNALVPLAFAKSSKASCSQFSRVLQHAHDRGISSAALRAELAAKTIKVAYQEAVEFYDSAKRRNSQAKLASRISAAKTLLASRSLSAPIVLSTPEPLAPGYASVLVRINDNNEAEIVSILDTDGDRLVLAVADVAAPADALAHRPLFGLYRAIDIVLGLTPDNTKSAERCILIRNTRAGICRVMSISAAYNAPWAYVDIPSINVLAPEGHALDHQQASAFLQRYEQGDWSLIAMGAGDLVIACSPNEGASVPLPRFVLSTELFVGSLALDRDAPFNLGQREAATFTDFLAEAQSTFERASKKAPGKLLMPKRLALECDGLAVSLRVASSQGGGPQWKSIGRIPDGRTARREPRRKPINHKSHQPLAGRERDLGKCLAAKRFRCGLEGRAGPPAGSRDRRR